MGREFQPIVDARKGASFPMTRTNGTDVDVAVEQFAGETVLLTASITRVLNRPTVLEGEVSGTGKTIAVEKPHSDSTCRLDTVRIMAGECEVRDSWGFKLYTREGFQSTQRANYGPGPQAGTEGASDADDLPEPTHEPVTVEA